MYQKIFKKKTFLQKEDQKQTKIAKKSAKQTKSAKEDHTSNTGISKTVDFKKLFTAINLRKVVKSYVYLCKSWFWDIDVNIPVRLNPQFHFDFI